MYIPSLPSHTHHPPPTLPHRDTQGAGGKGPSAEWRIKASLIPPALVSSHNLGSAMGSPVTLPYINLQRRQKRNKEKVLKNKQINTQWNTQEEVLSEKSLTLDQKMNLGTKCIIVYQ